MAAAGSFVEAVATEAEGGGSGEEGEVFSTFFFFLSVTESKTFPSEARTASTVIAVPFARSLA